MVRNGTFATTEFLNVAGVFKLGQKAFPAFPLRDSEKLVVFGGHLLLTIVVEEVHNHQKLFSSLSLLKRRQTQHI